PAPTRSRPAPPLPRSRPRSTRPAPIRRAWPKWSARRPPRRSTASTPGPPEAVAAPTVIPMTETSLLSPVLPASVLDSVAELFDSAVAQHRTAGITWAIIGGHAHQQAVLAHGAAGHRELTGGRPTEGSGPMGRGTISRIASMTKSFTAATILALRDE